MENRRETISNRNKKKQQKPTGNIGTHDCAIQLNNQKKEKQKNIIKNLVSNLKVVSNSKQN